MLAASPLAARAAIVGPVQINIPPGFELGGSQHGDGMQTVAWARSVPDANSKTLLQVFVYDFGTQLANMPADAGAEAAEHYLHQYLEAIERRRTDYTESAVHGLRLAGLAAQSATWTGRIGDVQALGAMYCVVVKKRFVVILHTQDIGAEPSAGMRAAMDAITSIALVGS